MTRVETCARIEECRIVPIVRAGSGALALRAAEAILAGGISVLEITMTVPDATTVIRVLREKFGGRVVLGAGTVMDGQTADACVDAGADFIVSPGFDPGTVAAARARGVVVMPGALTPTEVIAAWRSGADMVKIFPCSALGGPKYIRALRGPLPEVKLMATGGVNVTTLADYLAAGASALGVGAELVDPALLAAGGDSVITERARDLVKAVAGCRGATSDR